MVYYLDMYTYHDYKNASKKHSDYEMNLLIRPLSSATWLSIVFLSLRCPSFSSFPSYPFSHSIHPFLSYTNSILCFFFFSQTSISLFLFILSFLSFNSSFYILYLFHSLLSLLTTSSYHHFFFFLFFISSFLSALSPSLTRSTHPWLISLGLTTTHFLSALTDPQKISCHGRTSTHTHTHTHTHTLGDTCMG